MPNHDPNVPLEFPTPEKGRAIARGVTEAVVGLVPGGDVLTAIYRETHPSHYEERLQAWQKAINDRVNEHDQRIQIHSVAIEDLQAFIRSKAIRPEAGTAGKLSFFRTGMLGTLELIAAGRGDEHSMERLKAQLAATASEVEQLVESLHMARDILSGQPGDVAFAHQLDQVLYGRFGKVGIREGVGEIVELDPADRSTQELAKGLCNDISRFNRLVVELSESRRTEQFGNE